MDINDITITILILAGLILMVLAALAIRRLLALLRGTRYLKEWHLLWVLVVFFLIGYGGSLLVAIVNRMDILALLTGIIYLFGALFVWVVIRLGQHTFSDLFSTTVSKDYVENILKAIPDLVIVAKADHSVERVNQQAVQFCGYSESDLLSMSLAELFPDYDFKQIDCLHPDTQVETNLKILDGRLIPVSLAITALISDNCEIKNLVCLAKDITEQKQAEEKLEHDASHDSLTGLANRAMLLERLGE